MTGIVIRLTPNRGYGFIRGDDGISRFFTANDADPPLEFDLLREGHSVEFTPSVDTRPVELQKGNGLRATKVRRVMG